ncbi:MAG: Integral membrane protein, partial [uncultured Friedmanniella sp.]
EHRRPTSARRAAATGRPTRAPHRRSGQPDGGRAGPAEPLRPPPRPAARRPPAGAAGPGRAGARPRRRRRRGRGHPAPAGARRRRAAGGAGRDDRCRQLRDRRRLRGLPAGQAAAALDHHREQAAGGRRLRAGVRGGAAARRGAGPATGQPAGGARLRPRRAGGRSRVLRAVRAGVGAHPARRRRRPGLRADLGGPAGRAAGRHPLAQRHPVVGRGHRRGHGRAPPGRVAGLDLRRPGRGGRRRRRRLAGRAPPPRVQLHRRRV